MKKLKIISYFLSVNILLASLSISGQGSLRLLKQRVVKDLNNELALIERGVQAAKKFATLEELTAQEAAYLQGLGKRVGAVTAGLIAIAVLGLGAYFGAKKLRQTPEGAPVPEEQPITSRAPSPEPEESISEEESESEEEVTVPAGPQAPAPVTQAPSGVVTAEGLQKQKGGLKKTTKEEAPPKKKEEGIISESLGRRVGEVQAAQLRLMQERERERQQEVQRQKDQQIRTWQDKIRQDEQELLQKQKQYEQDVKALAKFGPEPEYQAKKKLQERALERTRASLDQEKEQLIKSKQGLETYKKAPIVLEESEWEQ